MRNFCGLSLFLAAPGLAQSENRSSSAGLRLVENSFELGRGRQIRWPPRRRTAMDISTSRVAASKYPLRHSGPAQVGVRIVFGAINPLNPDSSTYISQPGIVLNVAQ